MKAQGLGAYLKHFAAPPGAPLFIAPIMLPIEIISHFSRVLSLSLRLFGNIFGEELVILILFSIVPFVVPLPMMFLGVITSSLQAFIFVMLTMIYLGGAVAVEHGHEEAHGHAHGRRTRRARGGLNVRYEPEDVLLEEAVVVKNRFALVMTLSVLALGLASPVYAQEAAAAASAKRRDRPLVDHHRRLRAGDRGRLRRARRRPRASARPSRGLPATPRPPTTSAAT